MAPQSNDREVWRQLEPLMVNAEAERETRPDGMVATKTTYAAVLQAFAKQPKASNTPAQLTLETLHGHKCVVQLLEEGHTDLRTYAKLVSVRGRQVDRGKEFLVTLHAVEKVVVIEAGWKS